MPLDARVIGYHSAIDGTEQRAGLCGPAAAAAAREPLPLLVELIPGSISNLEGTLPTGRRHLELVGTPAVWVRPGGRGPGTVFQGYGELDVLEAVAAGRSELIRLHRAGDIDDETLHELERDLDLEELSAIAAKA